MGLASFRAWDPNIDKVVSWLKGIYEQFLRKSSSFTWLKEGQINVKRASQIIVALGTVNLNVYSSSFGK